MHPLPCWRINSCRRQHNYRQLHSLRRWLSGHRVKFWHTERRGLHGLRRQLIQLRRRIDFVRDLPAKRCPHLVLARLHALGEPYARPQRLARLLPLGFAGRGRGRFRGGGRARDLCGRPVRWRGQRASACLGQLLDGSAGRRQRVARGAADGCRGVDRERVGKVRRNLCADFVFHHGSSLVGRRNRR